MIKVFITKQLAPEILSAEVFNCILKLPEVRGGGCGWDGRGFRSGDGERREVATSPGPSRAGTGTAGRPGPAGGAKRPAAQAEAPEGQAPGELGKETGWSRR